MNGNAWDMVLGMVGQSVILAVILGAICGTTAGFLDGDLVWWALRGATAGGLLLPSLVVLLAMLDA